MIAGYFISHFLLKGHVKYFQNLSLQYWPPEGTELHQQSKENVSKVVEVYMYFLDTNLEHP